jgi:hypothetical protein
LYKLRADLLAKDNEDLDQGLEAKENVWPSDLRMAYFQLRCTHY